MSVSTLAVRFAARTLPAVMRDRYREQWMADLRDAEEAGLRPSEIAIGSLAFAASVTRPLSLGFRVAAPDVIEHRSRLALGLSLSAALLALSQYTSLANFGTPTSNTEFFMLVTFVAGLLALFAVIAPLLAISLVALTHGVSTRVRIAVALLVLASFCAIVQRAIDSLFVETWTMYASAGSPAYLAAVVLVAVSCTLVWRPEPRSQNGGAIAGSVVVLASVALVLAYAVGAWADRTPLVFGPMADPAYYDEWLRLKADFEALVLTVFRYFALAGGVLALAVLVVGRRLSPRRALWLAAAAVTITLIFASGLLSFLELGMGGTVPLALVEVLRLGGQVGLVTIVMATVGDVHFARKPVSAIAPT